MTDPLFNKMLVITDAHFGRSGNSPQANQDTLDFLEWAIDRARTWGATVCTFMGDWYDNRQAVQSLTNMSSVRGIDMLNESFEKIWWVPGNHDLFYRDRRDVSSIEMVKWVPNVQIIRDITTIGDCTFLPWLVGDETKKVKKLKSRYVFSHLEMPGFMMNSMVEMPDNPHMVQADQLRGPEYVFSGHYHKRQQQGNVLYTGNIMPFSFSDAWDEDRGLMLLEWGKAPIFEAWPDQPLYRQAKLSEIIEAPGNILKRRMTVKAAMDIELAYSEMQEIRDVLCAEYDLRKFELISAVTDVSEVEVEAMTDQPGQALDQIVTEGLMSFDSQGISGQRLTEMYHSLDFS